MLAAICKHDVESQLSCVLAHYDRPLRCVLADYDGPAKGVLATYDKQQECVLVGDSARLRLAAAPSAAVSFTRGAGRALRAPSEHG